MTKLNINKIGNNDKTLVFLHGWGFNQLIWKSLLPKLMEQFSIYLIDLPGFGQSSLMNWEKFKAELLNHLPKQVALVGWSLGGLFATRLAIEEPKRISHLINVASSPYFIKDTYWPGINQQTLAQFYTNLSQNPEKTTAEFIALQLQNFSLNTFDIKSEVFSSSKEALANGLNILANWDLRPSLNQLISQTCYMFGRLDAIVPRHLLPRMQELYPQFNYILFPKAAHMPFITHQADFIDKLRSFVL
ncbi:alpha/beta fold hydrolase [Legionella sp. D16C41]|uniref:alpha/beta fold hydrolase n=1 Tax=Legionella sp. D16C41 TaxID=3402688 RepID=UPI003AF6302E